MKLEYKGNGMTKKRALFLCWKLWEWLAENPQRCKEEWPSWAYKGGTVADCAYTCPICEYVWKGKEENTDKVECSQRKCPMIPLWGGHCLNSNSPFELWKNVPVSESAKYARQIARFAKRLYDKENSK